MPEDLHRHPGVHVQVGQQCPAGAARIVHRDAADPGRVDRRSQKRLKLRGSIGVPNRVVKTDRRPPASADPASSQPVPSLVSDAAARRRRWPAAAAWHRTSPSSSPAAPTGRRPAAAASPRSTRPASRSTSSQAEPEHLALTQAEHQDQDVRGVERVTVVPRGLQEPPRLIGRPRLAPVASAPSELDRRRDVAGDQPVGDRLRQDGPEHPRGRARLWPREELAGSTVPIAQQRRLATGRAASLPCAQHWQAGRSCSARSARPGPGVGRAVSGRGPGTM